MIYRPYTPSRQDPEVLERTATGREDCLSGLLASIEEASEKPIRQHWLLIGPRGIGKSYIIALLFHRIKRAPGLMAKWLPISFPEEAAGIITLRDFMEKVTRLCHEELENEGLSDEALTFRKILESVDGEASSRRAVNQIRESLIDWRNKSHRKLLILLENADRVIGNRIAKRLPDEKWLADLLMNQDLLYFIATSPTFFKQATNKDRPLCELFRIEQINELSFKESSELLIKYAGEEERTDLVKEFKTRTNRIQAIYMLAGGNPRLLIMLYMLVRDSAASITNVEVGFFNLLEELTPYFQSCMTRLTDQEEKILAAFAEGPEFLAPAELCRRMHMAAKKVTAHLKRLESAGFIKRIENGGPEEIVYRLSATAFRYWYQMNSERNREMSDIFIRFIILYYTYQEIEQIYISRSTKLLGEKNASEAATDAHRELQYLEVAMHLARKGEIQTLLASLEKGVVKKSPADRFRHVYDELLKSIRNILRF